MSASKRPSTSSLRRFIASRPYVPIAELRRRFALDEPNTITRIERDGVVAWIGLPDREACKLQELWLRGELELELSVEVRAPVVVGVFPMHIARYVTDNGNHHDGHAFPRRAFGGNHSGPDAQPAMGNRRASEGQSALP
jgi:hypothetical protein